MYSVDLTIPSLFVHILFFSIKGREISTQEGGHLRVDMVIICEQEGMLNTHAHERHLIENSFLMYKISISNSKQNY